jgi:hypothetical protein
LEPVVNNLQDLQELSDELEISRIGYAIEHHQELESKVGVNQFEHAKELRPELEIRDTGIAGGCRAAAIPRND